MGSHGNRPVKQHYVPQCYLRQFAIRYKKKGYQVAVFDRKKDKSFRANVKDVSCQNYFNRIEADGMDPDVIEKAMSEFETKLAQALAHINEARSLENQEDRAYLITLIGLTALRNPEMRENIRKIHEDVGKMNIAARLQSQATYDASVQEATGDMIDQASATRLPNFHPSSVHSASNRACSSPGTNWEMTSGSFS
jgi:hypothetical protein